MKKLKVLKIIIAIVMLIVICINVYNVIVRMQEKERYKHTYIYELAQKISSNELTVKNVDDLGTYTIIDLVLSENELWDKLPLSDNFKRKYKKSENIIKKYRRKFRKIIRIILIIFMINIFNLLKTNKLYFINISYFIKLKKS